ncbi:MAG: hypothetical protein NC226_07210 [Bacteroides cellulosilyticus]|nr:hypothetical protein [Bacteroides cellulosilyticus]
MRQKFKLKVRYTFDGYFTLRAASVSEAAQLVREQCGAVIGNIHTILSDDDGIDWEFDLYPDTTILQVETISD